MTTLTEPHPGLLSKPSDVAAPVREAGGDNEVLRDNNGRPRIIVECWLCAGTGKLVSEKTGNPIKCQGCGPKNGKPETANLKPGQRLKSYTRVTTYIDVLDDKSNIEAWQMRMVLVGVDRDRKLLDGASDLLLEQVAAENAGDTDAVKAAKDELNRRAQIAKKKAGAEDKADKGTHLHGLSELVDGHKRLPPGIDFGDVIDMDAYRKATHPLLKIVHMEKLVVNDEIGAAGTPDRVSECLEGATLVAPDGHVFLPGELLITDLKTGTMEYGTLKMAMQLSIYSRSHLYDKATGERIPLGNINQKWGLIMNVPAGSGEAHLYWADLTLGWEAVLLAGQVRDIRKAGRRALVPLRANTDAIVCN